MAPPPAPQLRVAQFHPDEAGGEGTQLLIGGIAVAADFGYGAASAFQTLAPGRA